MGRVSWGVEDEEEVPLGCMLINRTLVTCMV